jgi:hypothetical protein
VTEINQEFETNKRQNKRKQTAIATIDGTRKKRIPRRKRWTDEVEEVLNIMGIKTGGQWTENIGMDEDFIGSQGT